MKTARKQKRKAIGADDICRINMITSVAVAPDEKRVAYIIRKASDDKKKYYAHIFIADIATGRSRRFTFGNVADDNPVWSPDGKHIAFISRRDEKNGIYIIGSDGGAERRIIEEDGSFAYLN